MIRFKSFGAIDLRGPSGELRGVLTQPKRLALLLRLASERPGSFVRRDTLLAMFWPELDASGARNALRQALFHLRHELGDGVLVNRGDEEVGFAPDRFQADIADFEEAVAGSRWSAALDLLRGELAPGLFVSDATGFEEWLESQRAGIHRRAAAGALALCRDAESAGAPALAATWARRAMDHAPDDEAVVRRLLTLLIRASDAAGAAQAYTAFEERLRREYDVAPSAETQAIRATIPVDALATPGAPSAPAAADPLERPPPDISAPPHGRRRTPSISWALVGAGVLAAVLIAGRWRFRIPPPEPTNPARLLVAPFRTASADTALEALAVGLVDLTTARLSGASPPHPVDPDVALRAVAEARTVDSLSESQQLVLAARATGAGLILTGTLVREGDRLLLVPVVVETANGTVVPLPQISAPGDSLPWMVDRMAASLLSTMASEGGVDAPALAEIPLSALRAYLDGREAMRDGRVTAAMAALAHALELDSTFALAARDYAEAADWAGEDPAAQAKQRAWALGNRLGVRDRAILIALTGRRFPQLTPIHEQVEDWETAIRWAPDRSRTWFGLGDVLFHVGDLAGIPGAQDRARNAFDRALLLDSASVPALLHRMEMAARQGDTAVIRRLTPRAAGSEAPGDAKEFLRWRVAVALGDSAALRGSRAAFDFLSDFALLRVAGWGQLDGLGMPDPARALGTLRQRARTTTEAGRYFMMAVALAGNRGQIGALHRLVAGYGIRPTPTGLLFFAADDAVRPELLAMERAVRQGRDTMLATRVEVAFWHLWEGDTVPVEGTRWYLAEADRYPGDVGRAASGCLAAVRLGEPDASARLRRADSLAGEFPSGDLVGPSTLVLARCHEAAGDRKGALAMLTRRPLDPVYGPKYLAGYLYDEGRLAVLEGDHARALRAWRHLLVLRDDPDPSLRRQVERLRHDVDSLSRN